MDPLLTFHHLNKFIRPEFTFVDTNFSSKEELFESVGDELVNKKFVTREFISGLSHREKLGGTDLPSGTAVPHGNPLHVNQTVVVIIKNKKKFKWDKYYVDIIFLICISREDTLQTRKILSDIYSMVDESKFLKQFRSKTTREALLKNLGSGQNGTK